MTDQKPSADDLAGRLESRYESPPNVTPWLIAADMVAVPREVRDEAASRLRTEPSAVEACPIDGDPHEWMWDGADHAEKTDKVYCVGCGAKGRVYRLTHSTEEADD